MGESNGLLLQKIWAHKLTFKKIHPLDLRPICCADPDPRDKFLAHQGSKPWYKKTSVIGMLGSSSARWSPCRLFSEENRVLRECNRESFWYRSLPLGAVLASFTHVAIARGILRPNPRFGSAPKVGRWSCFFVLASSSLALWHGQPLFRISCFCYHIIFRGMFKIRSGSVIIMILWKLIQQWLLFSKNFRVLLVRFLSKLSKRAQLFFENYPRIFLWYSFW